MSTEGGGENRSPEDTFKILIATDIHLGFDHNKKRGRELDDSFTTFEEILQYAKDYEVDFILLGGDLFHDTKPTQTALLRCMQLFRKYCLGSRENKIEFLSDPDVVFPHCAYKTVNYEDPNLNVSIPVFSIHGNHDDPSFGTVGSLDLLSVSGLVNYFGKWTDVTKVTIPPLVMKKGETHIALYGLSYINDQRLSRLIRDFKIDMLRPEEIPDCFNILVLHQNRVKHGEYAHIPENKLPNFLNLILWGHEHECRITPEYIPETEYFITQPGSSIATSLCEAEAKPKYVGLLSINKMQFKLKKLKLKTVRPFVFDNLILQEQNIPRDFARPYSESIYAFVDNHIENELIPKAANQLSGHPKQPIQPLLRLRIFYRTEDEMFSPMSLAQKYCDDVANPLDMVVFRKDISDKSKSRSTLLNSNDDFDDVAQAFMFDTEEKDWNRSVQGGIKNFFSTEENKDVLTVLTVNGLNEALNSYVSQGNLDAFKEIIMHQTNKIITHLQTCDVDTSQQILEEIKNFRNMRAEKAQGEQEEQNEIQEVFSSVRPSARIALDNEPTLSSGSDHENQEEVPVGRGRGRGRGRGTGTGRAVGTRARGRGSRGGKAAAEKDPLNITTTSRRTKETKKQAQNTLETYMGPSSVSQSKPSGANMFMSDDSD